MSATWATASEGATPKQLSARSVVLSLMLGAHPDPMTPAALTRAGAHFDIPASTLRAALTRSVAAGDLIRDDAGYRLGGRLLSRQQRQDQAVEANSSAWKGDWETAVIVISGRTGSERANLREKLHRHRLAELREGVWMRPANLRRAAAYTHDPVLTTMRSYPDQDPEALARSLWDLDGWSETGHLLLEQLSAAVQPSLRLAVAANLVRHLSKGPILPAVLLPEWVCPEFG